MTFIEIFQFYNLIKEKEIKKKFPFHIKLNEMVNQILNKKKNREVISKVELIILLRFLFVKIMKNYQKGNIAKFISNASYFFNAAFASINAIQLSQKSSVRFSNYFKKNIDLIKFIIENKDSEFKDVQNNINYLIFYDDLFIISLTVRMLHKMIILFLKNCKKFGLIDKFYELINTVFEHNILLYNYVFIMKLNHLIMNSFKGSFNNNIVTIFNRNLKERNFTNYLILKYCKLFNIQFINGPKVIITHKTKEISDFNEELKSDYFSSKCFDKILSYMEIFLDHILNLHHLSQLINFKNEIFSLYHFLFKLFLIKEKYIMTKVDMWISYLNKFFNASKILIKTINNDEREYLEEIYYIQLGILFRANDESYEKLYRNTIIPMVFENKSCQELIKENQSKKFITFFLFYEKYYIDLIKNYSLTIENLGLVGNEYQIMAYKKLVLENIIGLTFKNKDNVEMSTIKEFLSLYENFINFKNQTIKAINFTQKLPNIFNFNNIRKSLDMTESQINNKRGSDVQDKNTNTICFYRIQEFVIFSLRTAGEMAFKIIYCDEYLQLKNEFYEKIEKEILDFQEIKIREKWNKKLLLVEKNIENFLILLQRTILNNDIITLLTKIYIKSQKFINLLSDNDFLHSINFSTINDFVNCLMHIDDLSKVESFRENFKKDINISLRKFYNMFYIQNNIDWFINEQPFRLLISSELNNFPIDNIPLFYNFMILRTISKSNSKMKNFKLSINDFNNVFYLINPGQDAVKSNALQKSFQSLNFSNLYENSNKMQNEERLREEMTNKMKNICKLYFYCGHSNGKKYFNSNLWKETRINFPSFLLGCSSVNIQNKFYDTSSIIDFVNYLIFSEW